MKALYKSLIHPSIHSYYIFSHHGVILVLHYMTTLLFKLLNHSSVTRHDVSWWAGYTLQKKHRADEREWKMWASLGQNKLCWATDFTLRATDFTRRAKGRVCEAYYEGLTSRQLWEWSHKAESSDPGTGPSPRDPAPSAAHSQLSNREPQQFTILISIFAL